MSEPFAGVTLAIYNVLDRAAATFQVVKHDQLETKTFIIVRQIITDILQYTSNGSQCRFLVV